MNETPHRPTPDPARFEPFEEQRPIPLPVLWVTLALAIWGAISLFETSPPLAARRSNRSDSAVATIPAGAQAFQAHCSTCHQSNGSGVRLAVPPLAGSPFVTAAPEVMVQIVLHGIDGPLRVGDTIYDGHMPAFSSVLDDQQIAVIVNHVRRTWGNAQNEIDGAFVAAQRQRFGHRPAWRGGAELTGVLAPELAWQPSMRSTRPASVDASILHLADRGKPNVWGCASCHGERGQGTVNVPRLAGLPAAYIVKQLRDYGAGTRRDASMEMVARGLEADEILGLANYYATLRAPSTARPSLQGDLARGERLALRGDWESGIPACFSCHGPSGFGVAPAFPALAAQHPEYTVAQLVAWVNGNRNNSGIQLMDSIAQAMSDADRRAIADYLASLPPVPATAGTAPAAGAIDAH